MIKKYNLLALMLAATLLTSACNENTTIDFSGPTAGWISYGGSGDANRHSPLNQITPENVDKLELAWSYQTGDVDDGSSGKTVRTSFQATPILHDENLYVCTPFNRVIALDAETGEERWSFDPKVDPAGKLLRNCRGVSVWADKTATPESSCATRILTTTLDARLIALDAKTGKPCNDFGQGGEVDLTTGIGDIRPGEYGFTSAPVLVADRVIMGPQVLDTRRLSSPGGVVRAFNTKTGALEWAWDPVPEGTPPPTEPGVLYHRGTPNSWAPFAADEELGLVYVPTGNSNLDFYGGHRNAMQDTYGSSVVALDINTGKVRWNFQTVHHDLWDYDVAAPPTLFDFQRDGEMIPALIQATKMGFLFFLDRRTGEPLFPIEERPVPQGDGTIVGEKLSATQPFPSNPQLHTDELKPEDAWGPTPWHKAECRKKIAALDNEGIFTPPSTKGALVYPGYFGGANWGGPSIDPKRNTLVINTQQLAAVTKLLPRDELSTLYPEGTPPAAHGGFLPQEGAPYAVKTTTVLMSSMDTPCNPPPWGLLWGVDTQTGEILWKRPLGTTRDLAPFPVWPFLPEGVPNIGGPITTDSGLTFIGATTDRYLRAFDTRTGEELWKGRLPVTAQATPMTYRIKPDSRQFVVIAAGGHAGTGGKLGDHILAYALPSMSQ